MPSPPTAPRVGVEVGLRVGFGRLGGGRDGGGREGGGSYSPTGPPRRGWCRGCSARTSPRPAGSPPSSSRRTDAPALRTPPHAHITTSPRHPPSAAGAAPRPAWETGDARLPPAPAPGARAPFASPSTACSAWAPAPFAPVMPRQTRRHHDPWRAAAAWRRRRLSPLDILSPPLVPSPVALVRPTSHHHPHPGRLIQTIQSNPSSHVKERTHHAHADDHVHELLPNLVPVAHPGRARQPAQRRHVPLEVRHRRVPVGAAHLPPPRRARRVGGDAGPLPAGTPGGKRPTRRCGLARGGASLPSLPRPVPCRGVNWGGWVGWGGGGDLGLLSSRASTILLTRSWRKAPSAVVTCSMRMRTMSGRLRLVTIPDTCARRGTDGFAAGGRRGGREQGGEERWDADWVEVGGELQERGEMELDKS